MLSVLYKNDKTDSLISLVKGMQVEDNMFMTLINRIYMFYTTAVL